MALTPEVKKEIITKYGTSATDTGSPEAQVALLSRRIVGRRRRILQYLAKTDINRYRAIIEKLGIRR
jgi:small subunit ribosomal protein S15